MISIWSGGELTGKMMLVNELCDVAMLQFLLLSTEGALSLELQGHSHFYTIMPNNVRGMCQSVTVCVCV